MIQLFQIIVDAYNKTLDFANGVMSKFSYDEFSNSVVKMYGQEPTFSELDAQIELIKNDVDMPTDKRIALLRAVTVQRNVILDRDLERKQKVAETMIRGNEKHMEFATKGVLCLLSGGLTLIPEACKAIEKSMQKNRDRFDDDDLYISRE